MTLCRAVGMLAVAVGIGIRLAVPVDGFQPRIHAGVLSRALPANKTIDADALRRVTEANDKSDAPGNQLNSERHFDNGLDSTGLCTLWKQGLDKYLNRAVDLSEPMGLEKRELTDREGALDEFGRATHALQDFYSHTNWIELHERSHGGAPAFIPQAPILEKSCDLSGRPGLYSGYFNVFHLGSHTGLGCHPFGPPPRTECHSKLNKDSGSEPRGSKLFGNSGVTHHVVALYLAEAATALAWSRLKDRIVDRYDSESTDGKCIFAKLAWGGDRSCHRKWGADGSIKTHSEYAIPGGRLIHELDLNRVTISFKIGSEDYPGPQEPPVYADVRGTTIQRGTYCQWVVTPKYTTPKSCQPYMEDTIDSDDARIKVTPYSEPIELDWRVTFPGKKPECKGPVIVRMDPQAPNRQPFLECPGGMPGLTPTRLTYTGTFKRQIE